MDYFHWGPLGKQNKNKKPSLVLELSHYSRYSVYIYNFIRLKIYVKKTEQMDIHYNFPNREEIEVLKESKLLSQVTWSGSTFHTLAALDEKVFCP